MRTDVSLPATTRRLEVAVREPSDDRWPDWLAGGALGYSIFILVISTIPPWHRYFAGHLDLASALLAPAVPSVVYGALVFVLAIGLRRRLRTAWWILLIWWLVLPQVARLGAIAAGERPLANAIGLLLISAIIVGTLRARKQFPVRRVAGNLPLALVVFVLGGAVVLLVGGALVHRFGEAANFATALKYVADSMLAEVGRIGGGPVVTAPWWVRVIVAIGGSVVVLSAATIVFRAPRDTKVTIADESAVRSLLRDFGIHDSLGYFATRRDKSIVWDTASAETARAGVSYRTINSVCLASGNPVGDPVHWPGAVSSWMNFARARGWSLAVMGAGLDGARVYADAGLSMLELGDEAILDLAKFRLSSAPVKEIRRSVTRLRELGYATRVVRHAALGPSEFAELSRAAEQWRGDGGDERGFSMALGRLGDPLDGACVLVEARDGGGALRGFLSFVPWGRTHLSLDLMRRDPTAENGLVELMVAALAEESDAFGLRLVSLNFAMFREAFERGAEIGAGPVARLWRKGLLLASRTWQLESLYRSNAKYRPTWQPRFIGYEYTSDLLRIGTAAGSAEGFLTAPSISRFLGRGARDDLDTLDTGGAEHAQAVLALMHPAPDPVADAIAVDHLPEQMRVRRAKVDRLRAHGVDPYPVTVHRTHTVADVRSKYEGLAPDTRTGTCVSVAGRILLKRDFGGLGFATIADATGQLQVMADRSVVGADLTRLWQRDLDLGDIVSVTGEVMATHTGELTVSATSLTLTTKALRPLPDKRRGLTEPDARVRRRYVDLAVRPQARLAAYQRSQIVHSLRSQLHHSGFSEVETPILQTVHGGANARPFQTHINALDLDLSLRIATELHLKRLLVGGMERVFEIGRQFRNEGVDLTHNPEFTSLEVYAAYADCHTMRHLTKGLIQAAAVAVHGRPVARRAGPDGQIVEYDLSGDWPQISLCDAVGTALGVPVSADTETSELLAHARRLGLEFDTAPTWGVVLERLYEVLCEASTTTPVFYTHFPKENSPLARPDRDDPRLAEKWDLVAFGVELATAYSELNDPVEQRARLVAQSLLAADGDPEAMQVDEDFIEALEYGMPPAGGMGMGVDRLMMMLTGLTIRDVILFPLVKPTT